MRSCYSCFEVFILLPYSYAVNPHSPHEPAEKIPLTVTKKEGGSLTRLPPDPLCVKQAPIVYSRTILAARQVYGCPFAGVIINVQ